MSQHYVRRALKLLQKAAGLATRRGRTKRADRIRAARQGLLPVEQHVDPTPPATHKLFVPGAVRKPIPQTSSDPTIIPVGPIFHVAVSEASSLHDFFSNDGGIESTGYIRRDGTVEQYRPLNVECDAQFDGNSWIGTDGRRYGFTSWETQGMGEGTWTPEQVASIEAIIAFHHEQWGTPYRVAPAWNVAGVGYHSLFAEWNHNNHSCPGPDRIVQFRRVIVPWLRQQAAA